MRTATLLAICCAVCHASVKKVYNPCNCRSLAKYDNGVIYDRIDCCANWTAREPLEPIVQIAGVVYRFDRNRTRYEPYSTFFINQVDFPGEEVVLYDPNNMYTNYTCKDFSCRRALVLRNITNATAKRCDSLYDNGDCVDYRGKPNPLLYPPLCHNSTDLMCVIWVPISETALGGDALLSGTIAAVSTLAGLVLLAIICSFFSNKASTTDACLMIMLLVYLLTLSLLTIIAVWRFEKWAMLTEVNLSYATYQTCLIECATKANSDLSLARTNQCADLGISCSNAPSAGNPISCRGCKEHSIDWSYVLAYNEFVKSSICIHWVTLTIYAAAMGQGKTKNHGALICVMVPLTVLVIMSGVLNAKVTILGAHGLTQYSSLTGTPLLADLGMAWTICGSVWLFFFILAKAVDIGSAQESAWWRRNASAEIVFCS